MNKLVVISLALFVAGCHQSLEFYTPEYKVVKAPDYLYNCPLSNKFPNPDKLTDQQVGDLILNLHKNNVTCKKSLDSIKKFYDDADQTTSKNNS